jgi:hypothetical protein
VGSTALALLLALGGAGFRKLGDTGVKGENTGQYFLQFYNNVNGEASDVNVKVKLAIFCVKV